MVTLSRAVCNDIDMTITANQDVEVNVSAARPHRVVFVVFDQIQLLDLSGPLDVFSTTNRLFPAANYELVVASTAGGLLASSAGLAFDTKTLRSVRGPIDTLLVVGGVGTRAALHDAKLLRSIRHLAAQTTRIASVCSGAFLLAEAGLLEGRRATTHWQRCEALAKTYPTTTVEPNAIYVVDGDIWTSAGVTAGIDLALAFVGHDHNQQIANDVARQLVMHGHRSGGQSQFLAPSAVDRGFELRPERFVGNGDTHFQELLEWIGNNLTYDLSVKVLAKRAAMSARNFARVFQRETSSTPGAYVESLRLEHACGLLETTNRPILSVAKACGFGTVETMHRVFRRRLGITPGQHREHFQQFPL